MEMSGGIPGSICIRLVNRHEMLWMRQWSKPKLRVESVRISRSQQNPPQSLQLWVLNYGTHQQLRYAATAMLRHDKNIRNMRDSCKISNDSGKANLPSVEERAKAQRMLDAPLNDRLRNVLRPIRRAQKIVNQRNVQTTAIG
jgi:hypothetical protein